MSKPYLYWISRSDDLVAVRLAQLLGIKGIVCIDDLSEQELSMFHDILRGADDVAHAHIVEQVRRLTRKDNPNANVRGRGNDQT